MLLTRGRGGIHNRGIQQVCCSWVSRWCRTNMESFQKCQKAVGGITRMRGSRKERYYSLVEADKVHVGLCTNPEMVVGKDCPLPTTKIRLEKLRNNTKTYSSYAIVNAVRKEITKWVSRSAACLAWCRSSELGQGCWQQWRHCRDIFRRIPVVSETLRHQHGGRCVRCSVRGLVPAAVGRRSSEVPGTLKWTFILPWETGQTENESLITE